MENIFQKKNLHCEFKWENMGDIKEGRKNLGEEMPVIVYRLMQYTMLDVLTKEFGLAKANEFFRAAGRLAGRELAKNILDLKADFDNFTAQLQRTLKDLKVGILRFEAFDAATGEVMLTVGEDLDCSGLPITGENVCTYDEGFIAGILKEYTKKDYDVREIDCWASGERVCRFKGVVEK